MRRFLFHANCFALGMTATTVITTGIDLVRGHDVSGLTWFNVALCLTAAPFNLHYVRRLRGAA